MVVDWIRLSVSNVRAVYPDTSLEISSTPMLPETIDPASHVDASDYYGGTLDLLPA